MVIQVCIDDMHLYLYTVDIFICTYTYIPVYTYIYVCVCDNYVAYFGLYVALYNNHTSTLLLLSPLSSTTSTFAASFAASAGPVSEAGAESRPGFPSIDGHMDTWSQMEPTY